LQEGDIVVGMEFFQLRFRAWGGAVDLDGLVGRERKDDMREAGGG
jgi:hypothetical protein